MKFPLMAVLAAFCFALGGCAPVEPAGPIVGGPVYRGYYGQGYYNETPPGTYYGRGAVAGPYYGGNQVAVVRTGVYRDREYRERDYYVRDGRRYYRAGKPEYYRARPDGTKPKPKSDTRRRSHHGKPAQVSTQ